MRRAAIVPASDLAQHPLGSPEMSVVNLRAATSVGSRARLAALAS